MDALEQDIIDKFKQLEPDAKQRVLKTLNAAAEDEFDYDAWFAEVEALQVVIKERIGEGNTIGGMGLLYELREEES